MKILPVTFPFLALVIQFAGTPFGQSLADSKAAARGVPPAIRFAETANPSGTSVVVSMSPKNVMDLINQLERMTEILGLVRELLKGQVIADSEGVSP
jgi:hypothetical protein